MREAFETKRRLKTRELLDHLKRFHTKSKKEREKEIQLLARYMREPDVREITLPEFKDIVEEFPPDSDIDYCQCECHCEKVQPQEEGR